MTFHTYTASRKRSGTKLLSNQKVNLPPVSLSEFQILVKSLKAIKASGLDGISNKAIKCFSLPLLGLQVITLSGKAIIDEQFGIRPVHSCTQQVFILVEYITNGFKSKQKNIAVFFDVAKAFDRVWHGSLIYKLHALEVPDHILLFPILFIHILHSYVSNRYFELRHKHTHSTRRLIRAEVPQGSFPRCSSRAAYVSGRVNGSGACPVTFYAESIPLSNRP
ncbi:Probable RNA-directed DNA polymerase from transposon BS [Eumeta japonica]|uniref:Probable RNA-directed DNA polymerase from transposon BS n=1 Tax=Eumeta variegata TaxID=151549 RepID=A0A4C1VT50_EUMVA|nr:Probable RNA-directed DNA polymerase from transposon BS [Eumeta japonica]